MQKRNWDHISQQGDVHTQCMQYTLCHVRCRLTPIPFFRVCIKHLSKDDGEKICKNNYVNDDTLTDGGLKSLKQSDDSF